MNNEGNHTEVGILVRNLAADTKNLHDLIIEGNRVAGSLRLIAGWLDSLNSDEAEVLTFESQSRNPEKAIFRVSNGQGEWEVPQDLRGHMKKILELQERIKHNREKLRKMLGIDNYADYAVSIHDPSNR